MISGVLDRRKKRLLVEIRAELTGTHVQPLREGLSAIIKAHPDSGWKAIYLDARQARMIDSNGLNWLMVESCKIRKMKRDLVIRIASPAIYRVMDFAGLDRLATIKFRRRRQVR
jgi:anti-anti-sigma factor